MLELEVGSIGVFLTSTGLERGENGVGRIAQVVDEQNLILSFFTNSHGPQTRPIWITGMDTAGFTDGQMVRLDGVFTITGTKTYPTATGSNTVLVAEPVKVADGDDLDGRMVDPFEALSDQQESGQADGSGSAEKDDDPTLAEMATAVREKIPECSHPALYP